MLESGELARIAKRCGHEKLQTKRRPFLHGYPIFREQRKWDLYRKYTCLASFFNATETKTSRTPVVRKPFIDEVHCSPFDATVG
jgi:hypothetical protein